MPSRIASARLEPRRSVQRSLISSSGKRIRVLVVDDHWDLLNVIRLLLRMARFDVDIATSGEDAVSAIAASPPDVVVLDIELPKLAGAKLVAELRRQRPELPIVVLTGYSKTDPQVLEVLDTGGCAYVSKPVSLSTLVAAIAEIGPGPRDETDAQLDQR